MHNGMVWTQMPFHDIDKLSIGWTEDFYNDIFNTIRSDISVTWDVPSADEIAELGAFEYEDVGRQLTGKVTPINFMSTCARGVCKFGASSDPIAQELLIDEFRIERETWYKQLVRNNAKIDVAAFRQDTKV